MAHDNKHQSNTDTGHLTNLDDVENSFSYGKDDSLDVDLEGYYDALELQAVEPKEPELPQQEEDIPFSFSAASSAEIKTKNQQNLHRKKKGLLWRCQRRYPRLFAFGIGFFLPLLFLVLLAAACGYPLAMIESPIEMDSNDLVLENKIRLVRTGMEKYYICSDFT
jgi:hypothetical protein